MRLVFLLAALTLGGGCAAESGLAATHARYYDPIFAAQRANRGPARVAGPPLGLDSQEASIIAVRYVKSLAPATGQGEPAPVLVLPPAGEGGARRP